MIGRFRNTGTRRHGVTLTEVLLTLCLLVIIASLAWPALTAPFANQRLRTAADQIRAAWCGARVDAMGTGRTYVFRYSAGGNRYRIECYATAETAEDPVFADDFHTTGGGLGYTGGERKAKSDTLPDGVTFVAHQTALDTRAATVQPATELLDASELSDTSEAEWSQPILLYPDGTTSTAVLLLRNQYDRCIELKLRGLTGTVNVGEMYADEEGVR